MSLSPNEPNNFSLARFESMLKTNRVLFFDSEEFEEIVEHYLENGKFALAKKATKLGLEQHPTSTNLKLFQVEMYIFEDKLDTAEALLDKLYLLEQSNEEIYIQKANIYSRRNKHQEAIRLLEQALEITDDEPDVFALLGMEYLFLEDYENAKTYFIKCVEDNEEDYSALYNVVYCFEYLYQFEEAIEYLNDYLNKNPYSEVAWHQVGKQYTVTREYDKAIAAFDFAIISDDEFVGAYLEKGKVLEKMLKYPEAIENYTITLGLDDPTSFALLHIGRCYEKMNQKELALQFYTKCVEDDPLLDKGWVAITDFHYKNKEYQTALDCIDKAIAIDAENPHYWKRFAKIKKRLGAFDEAEMGYRKAMEYGNYELDTWIIRGDILIKLNQFEAAKSNFAQALKFYPDIAEIEYRLAGIHYFLKDNKNGEFHLINGLRLEPENSMIVEELFPSVYAMKPVREIIIKHKNPSF